jgi:hypothetical protein
VLPVRGLAWDAGGTAAAQRSGRCRRRRAAPGRRRWAARRGERGRGSAGGAGAAPASWTAADRRWVVRQGERGRGSASGAGAAPGRRRTDGGRPGEASGAGGRSAQRRVASRSTPRPSAHHRRTLERIFSTFNIIKTDLRNKMGDE